MKTVRKSVFETNSSTMHSITIQDVVDKSCCEFPKGSEVSIFLPSFERYPQRLLRNPLEKSGYALSYLMGYIYDDKVIDETLKYIEDFLNSDEEDPIKFKDDEEEFNILKEYKKAVRKHTNQRFKLSRDEFVGVWGDVGTLPKFLVWHTMEELIFNPDIIIVVDGDEYCKYEYSRTDKPPRPLEDPYTDHIYDFQGELEVKQLEFERELTFKQFEHIIHTASTYSTILNSSYGEGFKTSDGFKGIIINGELIKAQPNCIFSRIDDELHYGLFPLSQAYQEVEEDDNRKIRALVCQIGRTANPSVSKVRTFDLIRKELRVFDLTKGEEDKSIFDIRLRYEGNRMKNGSYEYYYLEFYPIDPDSGCEIVLETPKIPGLIKI